MAGYVAPRPIHTSPDRALVDAAHLAMADLQDERRPVLYSSLRLHSNSGLARFFHLRSGDVLAAHPKRIVASPAKRRLASQGRIPWNSVTERPGRPKIRYARCFAIYFKYL